MSPTAAGDLIVDVGVIVSPWPAGHPSHKDRDSIALFPTPSWTQV
jgi:hypothetical protein